MKLPMNTTIPWDLQKYKDELFSTCEFVISWHLWFNWFPEGVSFASEHVSIKQKLKAKCYLWIRKVESLWIKFDDIKMYDGKYMKNYDTDKFNNEYLNAIEFLEEKLNLSESKYWFEVSILSECEKWEWTWFSGTVMALLVSWLYYLDWKLSLDLLKNYKKFQDSSMFQEIKTLAHQCTWIAKNPSVWPSFLTALVQGSHPYVYICDSKNESHYADIPNLEEYHKDLSSVFGIEQFQMNTIPLRWALVYTWQKVDVWFASRQREFVKYLNLEYQKRYEQQEFGKIENWLKSWFEKLNYFDMKVQNLNNMSIRMLSIMENIYKKWAQNVFVHKLIRTMNMINWLYNDIEQDFDITKDFESVCIKNGISIETFWFSPIFTNKYGWNYLVLFEDDSDLDILEKIVEDMKYIYPDIRIRETYDFENPAKDGIVVEQDITNNIWKEIWKDLYILFDNDNGQKFVSYTDINPKDRKWIFFDGVKNKIYVNWKVLTSKDIKSATTTIELFYYLLKSEDHEVKNNELWPSSFSGQQNQMESKIINPFVKYIQKTFWKEFNIECSGSLREFYITLWKTDIPIQLVKKY